MGDVEALQPAPDPQAAFVPRHPPQLEADLDIAGDGAAEKERLLQHEGHATAEGKLASAHGAPLEHDLALGWPLEEGEHLEERRLAGAVGPDDGEDLALEHIEARDMEDLGLAAPYCYVMYG
jgi:hypothetical protein